MIVTLTMNAALDISTEIDAVVPDHKMRCAAPRYDPGGGGINAARVARVLGARVSAIFPAGGVTGDSLCRRLAEAGVPADRVLIAAPTRESFTVNELSSGRQYRFILPGAVLTPDEQAECLDRLRDAAVPAQFVVASGSLPVGVPDDFYQKVSDICAELDVPLILDCSGPSLRAIRSGVFLLKPSLRELKHCVGAELRTEAERVAAARTLITAGRTANVVVSLGADGALLVTSSSAHRYAPIEVPIGSGVGAGDAMVGAITVGLSRGWTLEKAVLYGTAAGAAMLLTPGTATCTATDVARLFEQAPQPVSLS